MNFVDLLNVNRNIEIFFSMINIYLCSFSFTITYLK